MKTPNRSRLFWLLWTMLPSLAHAQIDPIVHREVNLDYYLLSYFDRVAPPLHDVGGGHPNHYSVMSWLAPRFNYVNHDLDLLSTSQSVRSMAMGGAGVATQLGASALAVNPAGLALGPIANDVYFGMASRAGSGDCAIQDELLVVSRRIGRLEPIAASLDLRFLLNQGGLFLRLRPFDEADRESALGRWLGRLSVAGGYRRFVEMANPTNSLTTLIPEGGALGLTAEVKTAAQSREKGGVDAISLGLATSVGDSRSPARLSIGGAVNLVSGRIRADQVLTATLLTQIVESLPGDLGDEAYVRQKFTGTAFDLGVRAEVFGGALKVGGTFRPEHHLEMRGGRYATIEADDRAGDIPVLTSFSGRISGYDMELPSSLRVGGALALAPLIGDGVDRRGLLGYLHRFCGRAELAVDYARQPLSEAVVRHVDEVLDNGHLVDDPYFQSLNLALAETFGPGATVDPVMPHRNGSAELRDRSSIHVGLETPIFDRSRFELALRLGYETVPFSFASLVLGEAIEGPQGLERPVVRNPDGTPVLEDVRGDAISFGLGYTTGLVRFDVGFRSVSYDFVSWWGGARPPSWYDPISGIYGPVVPEERYAAIRTRVRTSSIQLAASLGF